MGKSLAYCNPGVNSRGRDLAPQVKSFGQEPFHKLLLLTIFAYRREINLFRNVSMIRNGALHVRTRALHGLKIKIRV